jgi:hypothetical protein
MRLSFIAEAALLLAEAMALAAWALCLTRLIATVYTRPAIRYGISAAPALFIPFMALSGGGFTSASDVAAAFVAAALGVLILLWGYSRQRFARPFTVEPFSAGLAHAPSSDSQETMFSHNQPVAAPQSAAGTEIGLLNDLARQWRGDNSLGVAYWICGTLVLGIATLGMLGLGWVLGASSLPLHDSALEILIAQSIWLSVWLWSVVGIWRSASRHRARGGWPFWANLAKAVVILGIARMTLLLLTSLGPQMALSAQLAVGRDPLGIPSVQLSSDGQIVVLIGLLGEGSASALAKMLATAPRAQTLMLDSLGGRIREARELAQLVRDRQLNTYVVTECDSACTLVFLAGSKRVVGGGSALGISSAALSRDQRKRPNRRD